MNINDVPYNNKIQKILLGGSSLRLKKILLVICAVALIGSISVTVYAATADGSTTGRDSSKSILGSKSTRFNKDAELTDEQKSEMEANKTEMQEEMRARMAQEFADGKITQEQYDEWITAIENGEMRGIRGGRLGFKGEMPELTDEQKAEMEAKRAEMQTELKARLAQELADGKITLEQYDERISAIEKGDIGCMRGVKPGFKGEMPELTDEQKAEMEAKRAEMRGNDNMTGFGRGSKGDYERGYGMREMRENGTTEAQKYNS